MSFQPLLESIRTYNTCVEKIEPINKYEKYCEHNYTRQQHVDVFEMIILLIFLFDEFGNFKIDELSRDDDESIYEFGEQCIIDIEVRRNIRVNRDNYLNKFNDKLNWLSSKFTWTDVDLVMDYAKCSNIMAIIALIDNECDLVETIINVSI